MAEENVSGGESKSRCVLGDITNQNQIGKRGFSGREKNGMVKCFNFNDNDVVKRICVSPRPCSEINSLKGNDISGLSKIPNKNRDPNVSGSGSGNAASKNSSADVIDDFDGAHCLKGKDVVIGNSKFHCGHNGIKILGLTGGNFVSHRVKESDVFDNDLIETFGQNEYSKDDALPRMGGKASQSHLDPCLADLEGEKVLNSIANEAGCGSQLELDLLKKNKILGTAEVAIEKNLEHSVRENLVDQTKISGGEYVLGSSEMHKEKDDSSLLDFGRSDTIQSINTEVKDELDDSSSADTSKTMSETGNDFLHVGKNFDAGEVNKSVIGTQSDINPDHNDMDDHNADNFVLSQSGSIDCTILPDSQESRAFGVDGSTKLKEDEHAYMTVGTDSIRACSCSFCMKAAYIWLDLQQKDMKARSSALKKSQKDASVLAERSCRIKVNEKHAAGSVTRVSKLESHLMSQWRSLFQHMADIWDAEGNQIEASLLLLNDLREKCRADLELINAKLSEKH